MQAIRVTVSGQVQGVGFRFYVCSRANALGIRGEVWNARDGSVQLVAESIDPSALEEFCASLILGPGNPRHVERSEAAPSGYEGFRVGLSR